MNLKNFVNIVIYIHLFALGNEKEYNDLND